MHHFSYINQHLHAEGVALNYLAQTHGTPLYVYSASTLRDNYTRLKKAFAGLDTLICFAMKANGNLAILRLMHDLGAGFDLVSGGELSRVRAAGGDPSQCVLAGVAKSHEEIETALRAGILAFHVESEPELERIARVARQLSTRAPVSLRVNPDVDAGTHAKITTGKSENKFGVPLQRALSLYESTADRKELEWVGVQTHIGSQILKAGPFVAAIDKLAGFASVLKEKFGIRYVSIGGGLGVVYEQALASGRASWWEQKAPENRPLTPEAYGAAVRPFLEPLGLRILLEPGRFITANSGVLLSRVEYVKEGEGRRFVILDAGMNDLARPAMYDAFHEIVTVAQPPSSALEEPCDVVGPVCETGDVFARQRPLPPVKEGDLVALLSAGAYGFAMASRYNARCLPAEVLVNHEKAHLVRRRESIEEQWQHESIPSFS